mmetsp:Transcript_109932/g.310734  ORF Transcript_109932/g.310734 Transcript_109932/m.310734 type:complete len:221 (-) Transcript_109932:133-795(-)
MRALRRRAPGRRHARVQDQRLQRHLPLGPGRAAAHGGGRQCKGGGALRQRRRGSEARRGGRQGGVDGVLQEEVRAARSAAARGCRSGTRAGKVPGPGRGGAGAASGAAASPNCPQRAGAGQMRGSSGTCWRSAQHRMGPIANQLEPHLRRRRNFCRPGEFHRNKACTGLNTRTAPGRAPGLQGSGRRRACRPGRLPWLPPGKRSPQGSGTNAPACPPVPR